MTQTVTESYLLGVRDERALLSDVKKRGEYDATFARDALANIESTMRKGFAGDMREYFRGGRDFWRNQMKREGVSHA